jgi:hypothetical protein
MSEAGGKRQEARCRRQETTAGACAYDVRCNSSEGSRDCD